MNKVRNALLLTATSMLIFGVVATQSLAYFLGYPSWLGEPFFEFFYLPYSFVFWSKDALAFSLNDVLKSYFVASLFAISPLFFTSRAKTKKRSTHGSSRWAVREDLVESGLLGGARNKHSLIVGGWEEGGVVEYLVHSAQSRCWLMVPQEVVRVSLWSSLTCLIMRGPFLL